MGILTLRGLIALCLAALLLGGCASSDRRTGPADPGARSDSGRDRTEGRRDADRSGAGGEDGMDMSDDMDMDDMVDPRTLEGIFYFDYDQAIVKRAGHRELNRHGKALANDRDMRVRLEGHADERGTREYNLALGERRANAVRAYLVAQGALRSQIEVISYGEEKPVDPGHSESAWARNRRVEIVYR